MINQLIHIYKVLTRWKKVIIPVMLVIGIFTSALMLVVPKEYTSYSLIYPSTGSNSSGVLGLLSGTPLSGAGGFGMESSGETGFLMSLFNSRSIIIKAIDKFDLMEIYDAEIKQELIHKLWDDLEIELNDRGAIELNFSTQTDWFTAPYGEDIETKNRAQEILQYIINEANRLNISLNTQSARFERQFLEQRYESGLMDLDTLKRRTIRYQKKNGIVDVEEQVKAKVSILSELKSELIAAEIEHDMLTQLLESGNPQISSAEARIEAVQSKLRSLESQINENQEALDKFLPNLIDIPKLSLEMLQKQSELEAQVEVLKFLIQQLEETRLREARDTPTLQIIDRPSLPEKRSAPQRSVTVLVVGFLTFLLLSIAILTYESAKIDK